MLRVMEPLTVVGIFVAGAAAGALLTSIAYSGKVRAIRELLHRIKEMDLCVENAAINSNQPYSPGEENISLRHRG